MSERILVVGAAILAVIVMFGFVLGYEAGTSAGQVAGIKWATEHGVYSRFATAFPEPSYIKFNTHSKEENDE